jgi:hypothetical protein
VCSRSLQACPLQAEAAISEAPLACVYLRACDPDRHGIDAVQQTTGQHHRRRELDNAVERALGRDRRLVPVCVVGTQTLEQSLDIGLV